MALCNLFTSPLCCVCLPYCVTCVNHSVLFVGVPHSVICLILQEIRRVWVGYWSQADSTLGQRVAAKLKAASAL